MSEGVDTRKLATAIRKQAVQMTQRSGASHVGSCLSVADVLAVLYGEVLRVDPAHPTWPDRDRLIFSKGHAAAALYAVLAESGFLAGMDLKEYYSNGSILMGHASHYVPGVELSTGSLGHGLSVAAGIAFGAKLDARPYRVVTVLSDGECDEGSVWEAAMFAGFHGLENLVAIVDYNKIQSLASTTSTLDLEPLADKWRAFRWQVIEVDGHDHDALRTTLAHAPESRPLCVLAHTTKGKGVSFMENTVLWHYRAPRGSEYDAAMKELDADRDA